MFNEDPFDYDKDPQFEEFEAEPYHGVVLGDRQIIRNHIVNTFF